MRVILSSDWHADALTQGVDRYEEIYASVKKSVRYAIDTRADLYVFGGDLADPHDVRSHRAAALAIEVAFDLSDAGISSVWIAGNHDVIEDGTGATTLSPLLAVPTWSSADPNVRIEVANVPRALWFDEKDGRTINVITLPFTATSERYDPAKYIESAAEDIDLDEPVVIVGHLNLAGITPGSETLDMPRGREVFWPTDTIRELMPKAVCIGGHYHKKQVFDGVHIIGSIARLTFGEGENEVGFLEVEV